MEASSLVTGETSAWSEIRQVGHDLWVERLPQAFIEGFALRDVVGEYNVNLGIILARLHFCDVTGQA